MKWKTFDSWLLDLTRTPTAPGHEQQVVDWVRRWARRRRTVVVRRDRYGNLLLKRNGPPSGTPPICFAAHMDHPAFVVTKILGPKTVQAQFRGGVDGRFFKGAPVLLHDGPGPPQRGTVSRMCPRKPDHFGPQAIVSLRRRFRGSAVDGVITWDTGRSRVKGKQLFAPACDDLAGIAAALAAFDQLASRGDRVRVLLTRAEEIGFVGAIGACTSGLIPRSARIVVVECSKSFADSPIGGGAVVRVGDRTRTFDPDLTDRLVQIAKQTAATDVEFQWRRCLMTGGTCEATAYQAYGYQTACLCLPLGHYHNMNPTIGAIDAETISLSDYHGLIRWLVAVGQRLDRAEVSSPLRRRFDRIFSERQSLLV